MKKKDFTEKFGLRFRLLMSYHDYTLKDIAKHTNCAISTVGTWKNGRIPSSHEVIEQLAELFGVSVDFLLDGKASGIPDPDMQTANRILKDIDDLLRELGDQDGIREPLTPFGDELFEDNTAFGDQGNPDKETSMRYLQLRRIQLYLKAYLKQACTHPEGLQHTWIELQKEFPLGLYKSLKFESSDESR